MRNDRTAEMRTAVAAGDWQTVLRLWEAYTAGVMDEVSRGACTPARMGEAREFLEWAKRVVWCSRAQAQTTLDRIHAALQYHPQPAPPRSSVRTIL